MPTLSSDTSSASSAAIAGPTAWPYTGGGRTGERVAGIAVHTRRVERVSASSADGGDLRSGANRGNLEATQKRRYAAIGQCQRTIETTFREDADALACSSTLDAQTRAQQNLGDAASHSWAQIEARYRAGVEPLLSNLDAQRTLYSATRSLTSAHLVRTENRVEVFRSLGGEVD